MDPRNPLGRLDWLSRHENVAEVSLRFLRGPDGQTIRRFEVTTKDGKLRTITMGKRQSWIDLLDRLHQAIDSSGGRQ